MLNDLGMPKSYCALMNSLVKGSAGIAEELKVFGAESVHLKDFHGFKGEGPSKELTCLKSNWREFNHPINSLDDNGKMTYFLMDLSSLIPVLALDIEPSDCVLDMCASPGGKTLALAMQLSETGQLISNEFNAKRRKRLYKVCMKFQSLQILYAEM